MKKDSNAGLGRIFRSLRRVKSLENVSDYILYKRIIITLSEAGYDLSNQSIVRHFSNVSTEEYSLAEKGLILKDLRKTVSLYKPSNGELKEDKNRI